MKLKEKLLEAIGRSHEEKTTIVLKLSKKNAERLENMATKQTCSKSKIIDCLIDIVFDNTEVLG